MAIELHEEVGGKLLIISVTGKLTRDDYKSYVPKVEELILKFGKIRMVFEMRDFHGWDASAFWEDIKFDIKHLISSGNRHLAPASSW